MIYALASGKGGVGKTTLAANLGIAVSDQKRTLLVDTDLASGNLALHLGLKEVKNTLHDLLAGEKNPRSCIYRSREKLDVLPAGLSLKGFLKAEIARLPQVLRKISKDYEVILLDTPPGISRNSIIPLKCADRIILVTTPESPSISATLKTKAVASLLDRPVLGVIVNRVRKGFFGRGDEPSQIAKQLGVEMVGAVPEEEEIRKSVAAGRPIILMKPKSAASKALKQISLRLTAGG
ncbi:MAG: cell division ATPase MinD [Candidatus Hadarchaeales archaeon]